MSDSSKRGTDIMIALGAFLCLVLGASVMYWLAEANRGPQQPVVVQEGAPIDAGKPAAKLGAPPDATGADKAPAAVALPTGVGGAGGDEFLPVSFSTLASYLYDLPMLDSPTATSVPREQIPQPIKALSGKKVAIQGFMVPTDLKGGKTTRFMLVKDQSLCCFGRYPRMNEWISVRMKPGKFARHIMDQPVTVFGSLEVGEDIHGGEVQSIYRIDSEDVAGPLDL